MDRFLLPTTKRQQERSTNKRQTMKFVIPSFEEMIGKIRNAEHEQLRLAAKGQKHIVPTKAGIMLYIPKANDRSYVTTEKERRNMNADEVTDAMRGQRDRVFGEFTDKIVWAWADGASGWIKVMSNELLEFHDNLNRIFKVTSDQRLDVGPDTRQSCLNADTNDFLKAARFINIARFCLYSASTVNPVNIEMYQYALPRQLAADVMCRGQYYRAIDEEPFKSSSSTDLVEFYKEGNIQYVSSLRYFSAQEQVMFFTGGSVLVTFDDFNRVNKWEAKTVEYVKLALPDIPDFDQIDSV